MLCRCKCAWSLAGWLQWVNVPIGGCCLVMLVVRNAACFTNVFSFSLLRFLRLKAGQAGPCEGKVLPCRAKPVSLATVAVCHGWVEPDETERGAVTHWTMHPYCSTHLGRLAEDKICALGLHSPGAWASGIQMWTTGTKRKGNFFWKREPRVSNWTVVIIVTRLRKSTQSTPGELNFCVNRRQTATNSDDLRGVSTRGLANKTRNEEFSAAFTFPLVWLFDVLCTYCFHPLQIRLWQKAFGVSWVRFVLHAWHRHTCKANCAFEPRAFWFDKLETSGNMNG